MTVPTSSVAWHQTARMDETLGCSKCRYSQKGCARCRDPAFRERQLTNAPGRRKLNGPGKGSKRGKKRPVEVSKEERDLLERPEGSKRTRFTRKARKTGGHARNTAAGTRQQNVEPQPGASTHTSVEEPANSVHAEDGPATLTDPQDPSASQTAPEAPEAAEQHPEASELQADSQGTAAKADDKAAGDKAAGGAAKQVASGLELGLMAGLLPMQQSSDGAEPARKSLEEATLVSKEPTETPAPRPRQQKCKLRRRRGQACAGHLRAEQRCQPDEHRWALSLLQHRLRSPSCLCRAVLVYLGIRLVSSWHSALPWLHNSQTVCGMIRSSTCGAIPHPLCVSIRRVIIGYCAKGSESRG